MESEATKNDLDYDPFASIDLIKMEDDVRIDQEVRFYDGN